MLGKTELGKELARLALDLVATATLDAHGGIGHVLEHRHVREKVVVLEHQAELHARLSHGSLGVGCFTFGGRGSTTNLEVAVPKRASVERVEQRQAA